MAWSSGSIKSQPLKLEPRKPLRHLPEHLLVRFLLVSPLNAPTKCAKMPQGTRVRVGNYKLPVPACAFQVFCHSLVNEAAQHELRKSEPWLCIGNRSHLSAETCVAAAAVSRQCNHAMIQGLMDAVAARDRGQNTNGLLHNCAAHKSSV